MTRYKEGVRQEKINSWIETLSGKKVEALNLMAAKQAEFKQSFQDSMVPLEPELRDLVRLGQCILDGALNEGSMFGFSQRPTHGMVRGWFPSDINPRADSFFGFISTREADEPDFSWKPGMHIDAIGYRGSGNIANWLYYLPEYNMWSISDPTQSWEDVLTDVESFSLGDIYVVGQLMSSFRDGYSEFIKRVEDSMESLTSLDVDEYVEKSGRTLLEIRKKED